MLWIMCDPSSGSTELCLSEITLSGSQIFFVCLVGVWQRNFDCNMNVNNVKFVRKFNIVNIHITVKITLPNTNQAHQKYL